MAVVELALILLGTAPVALLFIFFLAEGKSEALSALAFVLMIVCLMS
jgi:hypothetical protein